MQHRFARKLAVPAARFATLLVILCAATGARAQTGAPAPQAQGDGPTTIDAESIEGVSALEVVARGNVELRRGDLSIFSDYLKYNQEFGRVEASGGVRVKRGGDRFFGPRLSYDTRIDSGVFENPTFVIERQQTSRGTAERLEFLGKDHLRMENATYTTCRADKEDWKLVVGQLDLDFNTEEGHARSAKLRFLDNTIAGLPYVSFPLENSRKSGFLTPYYAQNTRRGLEIGVPVYWNIAPEQDATFTPVYMSKRGLQVKTDYRYIDPRYRGELKVEYLPNDMAFGDTRTGISLQHEQQFTPQLRGVLDLNRVSDDAYFVDLSSQVRQVSVTNLQGDGSLIYNGALAGFAYGATARIQRFQTLQDPLAPIVPPYDRVPQLTLSTGRNDIGGFADLSFPAEYVRFSHPTLVEGARTSLAPTLAAPWLAPGWFLTPKLGLHYATYSLNRTDPSQSDRQTVSIPWLSLDSGLVFDRPVRWFGGDYTQTFEPRAFYVRIPYRDQSQIPLFDTGLADFNYAQIFSENRFTGGDRFGDADELTLAATSRILATTGQELLRATLGQRFYFSDERVGLTADSTLRTYKHSDMLASVGGHITHNWTFDATTQYDPRERLTQRYSASVRYAPEIAKVLNLSYRFNRDPSNPIRQVDLSGQWPVKPGWYAVGRYNYSFLDGRLLEGTGGIEYNAGCWVFRGVFQRLQAATQVASTGFFFQLELNGLGGIGTDETTSILRRSVPGYAITNPRDQRLVPPSLHPQLPFEQVF
jgi:LPS-assembly protein